MGGTERQSIFLADSLRKAGHEAHLLLFRPGGALWNDMLGHEIPYRVLQSVDTKICFLAPGMMQALEEMSPDAILCMGRTANCYAGWIQRHFQNIGVIATLRTGKLIQPLHHWSLGQVRAVLVNSNWWKRRMLERGFSEDKIRLIHNPVMLRHGLEHRNEWRAEMRTKTGAGEHTKVFLVLASLRPGKRHMELLDSFVRYASETRDDWQLWIVGTGKELPRCRRFVEANGLQKRVLFFGQQAQTGPYYAGADFAVSASREDSLPNFLIEAQAMGLPLIAVECRGVCECCIPERTGIIVPPDRPALFAEALQRAANDQLLQTLTMKEAPAFVAEKFGAEKQAALSVAFLEEIANATRSRATKAAAQSDASDRCAV